MYPPYVHAAAMRIATNRPHEGPVNVGWTTSPRIVSSSETPPRRTSTVPALTLRFVATPAIRSPPQTSATIDRITANTVGPCHPLMVVRTPSAPAMSAPGPLYLYQNGRSAQMKYRPAAPRTILSAEDTLLMLNDGCWAIRAPFEGSPVISARPPAGFNGQRETESNTLAGQCSPRMLGARAIGGSPRRREGWVMS